MKVVAISDPHLGQTGADGLGQRSLLSTRSAQNLVPAFADAVGDFAAGDPFVLIFAGDLLDLSLAYVEDALVDLVALIEAVVGQANLQEVVHLVGNHDHHVWSLHSEDRRILAPLREGRVPLAGPEAAAKAAYHVTSPEGEPHALLQPVFDRVLGALSPRVTIAYPTFVRQLPDDVWLYVTHGHLFGGLYTELSRLVGDRLAGLPHDRIAAVVNQPLIELVYWLLGETGEGLGADGLVEAIYTDSQRGEVSRVRGIVARAVEQILPRGVLWRAIGRWERRAVVDAVMDAVGRAVRSSARASSSSADRFAAVETTRAGLRAWLEAVDWPSTRRTIALYGHTHVWDDWEVPGTSVRSWNLGTWLVEPDRPPPRTGFLGIRGAEARWVDVEARRG